MKYILTYNEQFNKDLLYLLPDLEVKYYIGDDGTEVRSWQALEEEDWNDTMLILCDTEDKREYYEKKLPHIVEGRQYIWGRDFLKILDRELINSYVRGRKCAVWGMGNTWDDFRGKYELDIAYFIDSAEKNEKNIVKPEAVQNWNELFVIVTSSYYEEIAEELKEHGLKEYKDFISCFELWEKPSDIFMAMQTAEKYENIKCIDPFSLIRVNQQGNVHFCVCPGWIRKSGNLLGESMKTIEKRVYTRLLRLSVINKTYYFCAKNKGKCGLFDKDLFLNGTCAPEKRLLVEKPIKRQLIAAFDESCNLRCESCRKEYIVYEQCEKIQSIEQAIETQILPYANGAIMAVEGEFFLSKYYQELVCSKNFQNIEKLMILSNGILYTEERWKKLREHYKGEVQVRISIDAASKDTYKKIRGGDFDKVLKALEFISSLRQQGEVTWFGINFVIQRSNMNEILDFVKLGEKYKVDKVYFGHLDNWGTFSDEEYEQRRVFIGKTRKPTAELQKLLEENGILDHELVNWQNINMNFRIKNFHGDETDEFQ